VYSYRLCASGDTKQQLIEMKDDQLYKSNNECIDILKDIFDDGNQFYNQIAPKGLKNGRLLN